jgi:hypothetical protein
VRIARSARVANQIQEANINASVTAAAMQFRLTQRLILTLSALSLFAACHQINHGTVVGKKLIPAETLYMPTQMSFDGGKTTTWIMMPMEFPDSYIISVSGRNQHGQRRTEDFYVDQDDFSKIQIGDLYTCGEVKQCVVDRPGGHQAQTK